MSEAVHESSPDHGRAVAVEQVGAVPVRIRPESAAAYIADITAELAGMARASRLEILAYLLDIAQLEAGNTSRRLAREAGRSD